MSRVVAIVGPTAVGKSALADALAERMGGPVVSADAMQVYRGMDIGTAKVPVPDRRVPLLLVDIVDPDVPYSAALYQRDARDVIDRLLAEGVTPVVCGGTGLYIRAALDEMDFPAGKIGDESRGAYDRLAGELGPRGLHALLAERDPASAAVIHPNNVRRVVRALEMHDEGSSYAEQKSGFSRFDPHYDTVYFGLTMARERLYERIDRRVDMMFEAGLVQEVEGLLSKGLGAALTSRQAIGYKEVIDMLEGRLTEQEARDMIKRRSRRYAKRQISWFKRDPRIRWIDAGDMDPESAADGILRRLES